MSESYFHIERNVFEHIKSKQYEKLVIQMAHRIEMGRVNAYGLSVGGKKHVDDDGKEEENVAGKSE